MLDGKGSVADYVKRAKQLKMPALSITDHGNLSGSYEFYRECIDNDIEPILGCEFYFVPNADLVKEEREGERFHVGILARNEAGFRTLVELSNESHRHYYYKPLLDRAMLESIPRRDRKNLVVLSGCASSIIARKALEDQRSARAELRWWNAEFQNFYIELMHHNTKFDLRLNDRLLKLAARYELPWVITNDPHYVMKEECDHHDALLAIQTASDLDDPNRFRFDGSGYHLRSRREIERTFRADYAKWVWRPGIAETLRIAEKCRIRIPAWDSRSWHIPSFPGVADSDRELRRLALRGLADRGLDGKPAYVKRVKHELAEFKKVGMADFLLITRDANEHARKKNIRVGPGRGSVCGTLVGYLIGIHKIDPIRYDLLFERFLNPERPKMPDIDTDFPSSVRNEMISYASKKYGDENTQRVGAFQTMQIKAAFRNLARAFGIDFNSLNRLAKLIEEDAEGNVILPAEIEEGYPELHGLLEGLTGVKKGVSRHAAGVIILAPDDDVRGLLPIQWIPSSKAFVSQFDLDTAAGIGLLKNDYLSLRTLDTIDECVRMVSERHGVDLDPDSWVPDEEKHDKQIYKMLAKGDVEGVFQMEGGTNRRGIKEIACNCFEDIVACFPAGTEVSGPPAIGCIERPYEGDLITLHFRSGNNLSVTPNHPLLGPSGWTPAGKLCVGDNLLRSVNGQGMTPRHPNVQNEPSLIEQVVAALRCRGQVERIGFGDVNLHGDRPTTDVEVVRPHSLLRDDIKAVPSQVPGYLSFARSDLVASDLPAESTSMQNIVGQRTTSRFMSRVSKSRTFFGRGLRHAKQSSFRATADRYASLNETSTSGSLSLPVPSSESLERFSGDVTLDEIVKIDVLPWSGHVMTLQTTDGWFAANGIVAGNCTSLYRKGPLDDKADDRYLKNKRDGKIRVAHKSLKQYLGRTWGEMIYQEQMFQMLNELAGFSWARVDDAKTAMVKKDPKKMALIKDDAVAGFRKVSGMDKETAEKVWEKIQACAGYLFNRSHAVAYSMLTYQTARLKYLYPQEYMAALLRTVIPDTKEKKEKRAEYMGVAMQMGYKILPPDVNLSDLGFTPVDDDKLLFGLQDIKGVGPAAVTKIVAYRKRKQARFAKRGLPIDKTIFTVTEVDVLCNLSVLNALKGSGALKSLGVEPSNESQEELLSWQFHDPLRPFRKKLEKKVKLPDGKRTNVVLAGELIKAEKRATKTGSHYYTWTIRWTPGETFRINVWDSASELFKLLPGSIVMIEGSWSSQYNNTAVGYADDVKVLKKVTKAKKKSAA